MESTLWRKRERDRQCIATSTVCCWANKQQERQLQGNPLSAGGYAVQCKHVICAVLVLLLLLLSHFDIRTALCSDADCSVGADCNCSLLFKFVADKTTQKVAAAKSFACARNDCPAPLNSIVITKALIALFPSASVRCTRKLAIKEFCNRIVFHFPMLLRPQTLV